jgi:hypothetical protein
MHIIVRMTSEERAQLIEDIYRSTTIRAGIVEQARLSKDFDIAAAWEELEDLDASINKRVVTARVPETRPSDE